MFIYNGKVNNFMRPHVSVFIAASLDGYIARPDGSLDWLDQANALVPKGEDCGYQTFISSIDVIVMGRKTFEKVLSFEGNWPYFSKPVVVLSASGTVIPPAISRTVSSSNETPANLLNRLYSMGLKSIYVDGGITIQRFLQEGLISEITITTIPILLGKGVPLFGSLCKDIILELKESKAYPCGFVQTTYTIS